MIETPQQDRFEVQFHRKETLRIKNLQHPLYDEQKAAKLNNDTVREDSIKYQLYQYAKELHKPHNIETVKGFEK